MKYTKKHSHEHRFAKAHGNFNRGTISAVIAVASDASVRSIARSASSHEPVDNDEVCSELSDHSPIPVSNTVYFTEIIVRLEFELLLSQNRTGQCSKSFTRPVVYFHHQRAKRLRTTSFENPAFTPPANAIFLSSFDLAFSYTTLE